MLLIANSQIENEHKNMHNEGEKLKKLREPQGSRVIYLFIFYQSKVFFLFLFWNEKAVLEFHMDGVK